MGKNLGRHDGVGQVVRQPGQALTNNMAFERCNLLIVDAVNRDPNYLYSKRVWYLDPETYYIMWTDIYDQQGRYWKLMFNNTQPLRSETGAMKPVIVGTQYYDVQRIHAGLSNQQMITQPRVSDASVTAEMHTIGYLQRTYGDQYRLNDHTPLRLQGIFLFTS